MLARTAAACFAFVWAWACAVEVLVDNAAPTTLPVCTTAQAHAQQVPLAGGVPSDMWRAYSVHSVVMRDAVLEGSTLQSCTGVSITAVPCCMARSGWCTELWLSDRTGAVIYHVNASGVPRRVAGLPNVVADGSAPTDGIPARHALLMLPMDVSAWYNATSGGTQLWIAERGRKRIRHVDENGIIQTAVGNSSTGITGGDDGAAVSASLADPCDVHVHVNATTGRVRMWIADGVGHRVRYVDEDGIIHTLAGTGAVGSSGDGQLAVNATLNVPTGVTAWYNASTGGFLVWIAEYVGCVVRRVAEDGIIVTVAGTGQCTGCAGSGPALSTCLRVPAQVAAYYAPGDVNATLWIGERSGNAIRIVLPNGTMYTASGNGSAVYSGDGGLATAASFRGPHSLSVDASGSVWFPDESVLAIRKLYALPSPSPTASPSTSPTASTSPSTSTSASGPPLSSGSPSSSRSSSFTPSPTCSASGATPLHSVSESQTPVVPSSSHTASATPAMQTVSHSSAAASALPASPTGSSSSSSSSSSRAGSGGASSSASHSSSPLAVNTFTLRLYVRA